MSVKPMLGDWEIPRVALMRTLESRRFAEQSIPGRAGNILQDLNAAPIVLEIAGSIFAEEERNEFLDSVRKKFRAGQPLTFVADITAATDLQFVVVESMHFEEIADRPDQISYHLLLRESPPPPPPPPPNPLGVLDSSLLDLAGNYVDDVTGVLDALDSLADLPDFNDPSALLGGTLDNVGTALKGLTTISDQLTDLFGRR
jgi:hypothetical protein